LHPSEISRGRRIAETTSLHVKISCVSENSFLVKKYQRKGRNTGALSVVGLKGKATPEIETYAGEGSLRGAFSS